MSSSSPRTSARRRVRARPGGSTRPARPRTTRDRAAGELALHQVGGRGDLVGERRRGDRQLVAVAVRGARRGRRARRVPAAPIARSVCPSRQARPAVSVTTTATLQPGARARSRLAQPRGRGVGVDREREHGAGWACWRRRPRPRPSPARGGCARSLVRAAAGDHAVGLAPDDGVLGARETARPSALLTTLLVTTTTSPSWRPSRRAPARAAARRGRRPRPPRRSRRPGSAAPTRRPRPRHRPTRSSAAAAIAAVASWSVISSGTAAARDAGRLDPGRPVRVARCRRASRRAARRRPGRRSARRPRRRSTSTPSAVSSCSAIPRTWLPATMGESPTTGARWSAQRLADAGHAEDGADRDDRVGRRQHARRRRRRSPRPPRGRAWPCRARPGPPRAPGTAAREPDPVLLEVDRPPPRRLGLVVDDDVGLDPVVGHRQQPTPGCHRRHSASVTAESGIARRRASGCGRGGWRGRGRRGRTRSARRRTPPAPPWRARSRRCVPTRARRRCRRRGCTSPCRGRGRP